jgi:hypothetical protein
VIVTGEYAIGWGTLSLLNAGLAQAKGHRGLPWFLVSLLIGPLATLLLVLQPTRLPPESWPRPHATDTGERGPAAAD